MSEAPETADRTVQGGIRQGDELPVGYKRTAVGMIPEDWQIVFVRELFEYQRTASNSRADLDNSGSVAYVHYGDIHTLFTHFIDFTRDTVPRLSASGKVTATAVREGDLIVADASEDEAGIGKSVEVRNIGRTDAISGLHTLLLRPRIRNRLAPGYRAQITRFATGIKVFGISKQALGNVRLPIPPSREQHAIAEGLSDVDLLLEALEALVVKKRAIKQAAMQQLLTGNIRLASFSEEWETKTLGDVSTMLPTATNPRSDLSDSGEIGYIHYGDVHAHSHPVLNCTTHDLPRIGEDRVGSAVHIQNGDLVMVDASEDLAGVGKSIQVQGVAERSVVAGLHTILCRGKTDEWASGFMAYLQFMPEFRSTLLRVASGTSVYAISKRQLAAVKLSLPPSEQEAIVSVLSDLDAELAALELRRLKIGAVKRGMMQQLLTGRIRLVEPEATVKEAAGS